MNERHKRVVLVLFMLTCFIGVVYEIFSVKSLIIDYNDLKQYQNNSNSLLNKQTYFQVDTFLLWEVFLSLTNMMFYLFMASIFYFESKRWQDTK